MKSKGLLRHITITVPLAIMAVMLFHYVTGLFSWGMRDWHQELSQAKQALALQQKPEDRFYTLTRAQMAAFECKEFELAGAYAAEALKLAPRFEHDWNYGNAVHDGHVVVGRLALVRGDLETACTELLLAGTTPGSPQLDSFGPNMALAKELLEQGRRDAVFAYFDECGRFWKHDYGKLARWRILARLHLPPDFGSNLVY